MTQTVLTTGDVMLREIIQSPHDKVLRSIYADWLEEAEQCLPGGQLWPWRVDLIRWGGSIRLVRLDDKTTHSSSIPAYLSGSAIQLSGGLVWRHRDITEVEYRHGFIEAIKAPLEVLCKGLSQWVTEYPLVEVEVSDKEPELSNIHAGMYYWRSDEDNPDSDPDIRKQELPVKVWLCLEGGQQSAEHSPYKRWDTPQLAIKALSDTLLDMARKGTL